MARPNDDVSPRPGGPPPDVSPARKVWAMLRTRERRGRGTPRSAMARLKGDVSPRPGGPPPDVSPARAGIPITRKPERRRRGAPHVILRGTSHASMSHSYSNNYVHAIYSTKDRRN